MNWLNDQPQADTTSAFDLGAYPIPTDEVEEIEIDDDKNPFDSAIDVDAEETDLEELFTSARGSMNFEENDHNSKNRPPGVGEGLLRDADDPATPHMKPSEGNGTFAHQRRSSDFSASAKTTPGKFINSS